MDRTMVCDREQPLFLSRVEITRRFDFAIDAVKKPSLVSHSRQSLA
jgi:hypothetical protein